MLRGPAPEAAERLLTNVEAALQLAPTVSEEAVGKGATSPASGRCPPL